jgi:hypothetical protein
MRRSATAINRALDVVVRLLQSEAIEEQGKLCFILGMLEFCVLCSVSGLTSAELLKDDPDMQRLAAEQGCPKLVIQVLATVEGSEQAGDIGEDLASRVKEVGVRFS